MSMQNTNDTIGNRTNTVPQTTATPRASFFLVQNSIHRFYLT